MYIRQVLQDKLTLTHNQAEVLALQEVREEVLDTQNQATLVVVHLQALQGVQAVAQEVTEVHQEEVEALHVHLVGQGGDNEKIHSFSFYTFRFY